MAFPNADDVKRMGEAVATKSAIEEADFRQSHGAARASGGTGGARFVGSVPIKTAGGWFAQRAIGAGYTLSISPNVEEGTIVEYHDESQNYYGRVVSKGKDGVEVKEISESEADEIKKKDSSVKVIRLGSAHLETLAKSGPVGKVIAGIGRFFFPSDDDSVNAFLMMFLKLIGVVAIIIGVTFGISRAF